MKSYPLSLAGFLLRPGARAIALIASPIIAILAAAEEPALTIPQTGTSSTPERTAYARAYTLHYGTAMNDSITGVESDALGNVYVAGNSMAAEPSGFLRKHSPDGTLLWEKSKHLTSIDGISLDRNGNSYISGSYHTGTMLSQRYFIYLEKHDADGNPLWIKSFRAAAASDPTQMSVNGLATDPTGKGSVIILFERSFWPYQSTQVFIRKYNSLGTPLWEKPAGASSPYTARPVLSVDGSGMICTAVNMHLLNREWNTTIGCYDTQGDPVRSIRLYATSSPFETLVHAIRSDAAGNLFVTGITKGNLDGFNRGFFDAFVRKYDNAGNELWTRQFGTADNDYANGMTSDAEGNVYLAGSSSGSLTSANRGSFDAVFRKYGSNGDLLNSRQFGSADFDIAYRIALDVSGNLFVAGHTNGNLGGKNKGLQDVYLRKFTASP